MSDNQDETVQEVHCYIDDQEVSLDECDSEENFQMQNELENKSASKASQLPEGSVLVKILVKYGQVCEKEYLTPLGEKINSNLV